MNQATDSQPRMAADGREHPFADLGVHGILTVEMPSPGMTVPGPACVKTEKRPPEFDREFEGFPGKAGSLLMRLLLAQRC